MFDRKFISENNRCVKIKIKLGLSSNISKLIKVKHPEVNLPFRNHRVLKNLNN